jgi:flavin reductase (DIM6/NTAB) family NADH-FMN oxidoreductase RutF
MTRPPHPLVLVTGTSALGVAKVHETSDLVGPPRVKDCPLQLEATAMAVHTAADGFLIVEAQVERVHAAPAIVRPGTSYIDTQRWRPLIYTFRQYLTSGERSGKTFRTVSTRLSSR